MALANISTAKLTVVSGTQSRVAIDEALVSEYAEQMGVQVKEGRLRFPAPVVYFDGAAYWVADGFHRVLAWRELEKLSMSVDLREGDERAAVLYSTSANGTHGKPRSNADKRKAVTTLLTDPEWRTWSNREIGRHCSVSDVFVGNIRAELESAGAAPVTERVVKRGVTIYKREVPVAAPKPPATAETPALARIESPATTHAPSEHPVLGRMREETVGERRSGTDRRSH